MLLLIIKLLLNSYRISMILRIMETPNIHIPVPKTPPHSSLDLSRDDRLRIQTLYYTAGWSISDIQLQFSQITRRQIDYALKHRPTPQKRHSGRHVLLDTPYREQLVDFVTKDSFSRDIPWAELPQYLGWNCGEKAIRTALHKEGYTRAIRRRKPPLSPENQQKRKD